MKKLRCVAITLLASIPFSVSAELRMEVFRGVFPGTWTVLDDGSLQLQVPEAQQDTVAPVFGRWAENVVCERLVGSVLFLALSL